MAIITTSGDISGLLSVNNAAFDQAEFNTANYFANSFASGIYDAYYGNLSILGGSSTDFSAYSYSAGGYIYAHGSNLNGTSGSVSYIAFEDGYSTSYWEGIGNGKFSPSGYGGIKLSGKISELYVSLDNPQNDSLYLKGSFTLDSNFNLVSKFTQETIYTGDLVINLTGKITESATGQSGNFKSVSLADSFGSIEYKGNLSSSAYHSAIDSTQTTDDLLNYQSIFSGNDTFNVPDAARAWHGYGGSDKMYGGGLDDELHGDDGNDKLYGYGGNDILVGGTGNDAIDGGDGNDYISGGDGNDKITDLSGNNWIEDLSGNANITVGDGDDVVETGSGNDKITAGGGSNEIYAGDGNNKVAALGGNDLIISGSGKDNLNAGEGNNYIDAGAGNDKIVSGSGNDIIVGGAGKDNITGGSGSDAFVFDNLAQDGFDTINDFLALSDVLVFDSSVFTVLSGGITSDNLVVESKAVAQDSNDYLIFDSSVGKLYYDADGNDVGVAVQIATLKGVTSLDSSNLLIDS